MTAEQRERYSRHTLLPEVGVDGQVKLLNAKVLLLGAGGLGAPTALYLAAAGVGTIGLVDDDVVDASNLQRQVIHNTERIGMAKTASARIFIEGLNPDVNVVEHNGRLDAEQHPRRDQGLRHRRRRRRQLPHPLPAERRLGAAAQAGRLGLDPRLRRADLDLRPLEGPCYRCLYPTPPPAELAPSCSANGVLGVMAGTMGTLQANEVIKLDHRQGEPLIGRLLLYDALGTSFTELKVRRDPDCPICGEHAEEIQESEMGPSPTTTLFCAGAGGDR